MEDPGMIQHLLRSNRQRGRWELTYASPLLGPIALSPGNSFWALPPLLGLSLQADPHCHKCTVVPDVKCQLPGVQWTASLSPKSFFLISSGT